MESDSELPFQIGASAEARSFQSGFRGAWFRCKIKDTRKSKGFTLHLLEYFDFPDERLKWTKLYQVSYHGAGKRKERCRELMLRPCYPSIYNEKKILDVNMNSELAVLVDNSWKVGDLVDWWTTGCFWTGTITELLGDGKAKLELPPPPLGEGLTYEVLLKDLRPSLDWSPKLGWTLPTQDNDPSRFCARIIKPTNHGLSIGGKTSCPDADSRQPTVDAGPNSTGVAEDLNSSCPGKKPLHSMHSDTLEAAILDLEECVNKVKWLKRILKYGVSSVDTTSPQWTFLEPSAPS